MLNNPPVFNASITPQGRLTLTTATPVLTATVSGATTIIYTPYVGNLVPLFDGTNMIPTACAELSNITTNSAVGNAGPAVVANSSNYDLFVWLNGNTPILTRGPLWTSNTARLLTLTRQNGILLNTSTITNGPVALRGTYVGSVGSNGTASIDMIQGGTANGGTAANLQVWNMYNRVSTITNVTDSGASYTYTTATIRQARSSAGNQIGYMMGLLEDGIGAWYTGASQTAAALSAIVQWGVGIDSTTTFATQKFISESDAVLANVAAGTSGGFFMPAIGQHVISANENGDGANANNFNLQSTNVLTASIRN